MTITLKQHGVTYSVETKEDGSYAIDVLESFTNLMRCAGWHQGSIDNAIIELNEQIDL